MKVGALGAWIQCHSGEANLVAREIFQEAPRDDDLCARLRIMLGRHALHQFCEVVLDLRCQAVHELTH